MSHAARSKYPSLTRLPIGARDITPATLQTLPLELLEHIVWCFQASDRLDRIMDRIMSTRAVNKKHFRAVLDRLLLGPGQYLSGVLFAQAHGDRCARLVKELAILPFANSSWLEARHFCNETARTPNGSTALPHQPVDPPARLYIDSHTTDPALADAFELLQTGLKRGLVTRTTADFEACPCFQLLPEEQAAFTLFAIDLFRLPANARDFVRREDLSPDTLLDNTHAAKLTLSPELVSGWSVLSAWYDDASSPRGTKLVPRAPTLGDTQTTREVPVFATLADVQETRVADAYVDLLVAIRKDVSVFNTEEERSAADTDLYATTSVGVTVSVVAKLTIRRTCRADAVNEIETRLKTPASQLLLHEINDDLFDAMHTLPESERSVELPRLFDFTLLAMEIGGTRYTIDTYSPMLPTWSPTSPPPRTAPSTTETEESPCDRVRFGTTLMAATRYSDPPLGDLRDLLGDLGDLGDLE